LRYIHPTNVERLATVGSECLATTLLAARDCERRCGSGSDIDC
jgi:hypothetical protein